MTETSPNLSPERLSAFFDTYAASFNQALRLDADLDAVTALYTEWFLSSNPHGVAVGQQGPAFREALRKGYDFYRAIGTRSMRVTGLAIVPIDALHALVTVHWDSRYEKDGREIEIPFAVHYLVKDAGGTPKVFAYITGDEMAVLGEAGLLPDAPA